MYFAEFLEQPCQMAMAVPKLRIDLPDAIGTETVVLASPLNLVPEADQVVRHSDQNRIASQDLNSYRDNAGL